ncbi:MAG: STAS domain-containing protein, partial [Methanoregula sp.]
VLLIDMEAHYIHLDISSVRVLEKVVKEAQDKNVQVRFVGVNTVTMSDMEKQGLVELAGRDRFKDTVQEALHDVDNR